MDPHDRLARATRWIAGDALAALLLGAAQARAQAGDVRESSSPL